MSFVFFALADSDGAKNEGAQPSKKAAMRELDGGNEEAARGAMKKWGKQKRLLLADMVRGREGDEAQPPKDSAIAETNGKEVALEFSLSARHHKFHWTLPDAYFGGRFIHTRSKGFKRARLGQCEEKLGKCKEKLGTCKENQENARHEWERLLENFD